MTLQYRPDTDHLLYIPDEEASPADPLMAECCCELDPEGTENVRFDACCDRAAFNDLPDHPHFIVISEARDDALGNPEIVVYGECCYYRIVDPTRFPVSVVENDVTASTQSTCEECFATEGEGYDCPYCNTCNDCDPPIPAELTITFDGFLETDVTDFCSDATGYNGYGWVFHSDDCAWGFLDVPTAPLVEPCIWDSVYLTWGDATAYGIEHDAWILVWELQDYEGEGYNHVQGVLILDNEDPCDPFGAYEWAEGTDHVTAVVS